ncbi:SCO1664 family protein [Actinoplanes awajinensis]|uniref:Phosphatidylinositol kinase n=1 Tax=Actinoplanes awajinensis subsp. mycoplanecinus TaxID=135947 RepID=A0A101JAA4_9ACTN|nr:SCO1664 family protein [Actinoplanes awajinensis]KUL23069.1 phosphatidylinositol kinase [Actinoplanes awajinensis subsp. mycoplanecinus]
MTAEPTEVLAEADALELLGRGQIEIEGRLVAASNTTLRAEISLAGLTRRCVYKPVRGERPLWDFPDGTLAGREVSAYIVSKATGWDLVPPTILRDGPLGPGALQLWIDEPEAAEGLIGFVPAYDVPQGWFPVAAARDDDGDAYALAHADDPRLARLAVFDSVINNADRKGGHVLYPATGAIHGVDHGVSFHVENKLRTVLWGWTGKPLPDEALEVLGSLRDELDGALGEALDEHLTITEVQQVRLRVKRLLRSGRFPKPPVEWPAIPWPPI